MKSHEFIFFIDLICELIVLALFSFFVGPSDARQGFVMNVEEI